MFFKINIYFRITLDLQKSFKDRTEFSYTSELPSSVVHLMLQRRAGKTKDYTRALLFTGLGLGCSLSNHALEGSLKCPGTNFLVQSEETPL